MNYQTPDYDRSDDNLIDAYFGWLYRMVCDDEHQNYYNLLKRLFVLRFSYFIDNDGNRAGDGIYLHYLFARDNGYSDDEIDEWFGVRQENCSVLEMIVGVARRMDDILWDPVEGDRTSKWFWIMIKNLGLDDCRDEDFNEECVERIDHWIDIMVSRHYGYDGYGGLFPLRNPKKDQRNVEIWYQMQAWCIENFEQKV